MYKPRSGKINANLHLYSLQQLTYIFKSCNGEQGLIEMFDYVKFFEQGLKESKQNIGLEALIKDSGKSVSFHQLNQSTLAQIIER